MAVVRYRDPVTGKLVPLRVIKGDKGDQMFIRFSAYPDGTDMSEKWDAERNFMGIAFNHVAPTDKADYQWISLADISLGRYAEEGSADKYLFFVGNGTDENNRSNALTLDDDGNLNVTGDVTFGEDKFSPREAVAEQKEYIDKQIEEHTITADRVTDLTEFMEEYRTARIASGSYVGKGYAEEGGNVYRVYEQSITLPFAPKQFIVRSVVEYDYDTATGTGYGFDYSVIAVLTRIGATPRAYFHAMQQGGGDSQFYFDVDVSNDGKTFTWGKNMTFTGSSSLDEYLRETLSLGGQTYYYTAIG